MNMSQPHFDELAEWLEDGGAVSNLCLTSHLSRVLLVLPFRQPLTLEVLGSFSMLLKKSAQEAFLLWHCLDTRLVDLVHRHWSSNIWS